METFEKILKCVQIFKEMYPNNIIEFRVANSDGSNFFMFTKEENFDFKVFDFDGQQTVAMNELQLEILLNKIIIYDSRSNN